MMISENQSILHIANANPPGSPLRKSGLPGEIVFWRDVLSEGPVPAGVRREEFHRQRAEFLANRGWDTYYNAITNFNERDRKLNDGRDGQYILWFDPSLADQLQLLQVIDSLAQLKVTPSQMCVAAMPPRQDLSQLTPKDFAKLFAEPKRLSELTFMGALKCWQLFCGKDPTLMLGLTDTTNEQLLYTAEAFSRLAQEYPSTTNGLSLLQKRILLSLAPKPASADRIFQIVTDEEKYPYLNKNVCFYYIDTLLGAPHPAIALQEESQSQRNANFILTPTGADVLSGAQDYLALNGIDRWIGGVHLLSGNPGWRYNEELSILMPSKM